MNYSLKRNALILVASLVLMALLPIGAALTSGGVTISGTIPPIISIQVIKPQEKVGFGNIQYSDLPVTLTTSDEIMVRANVNWLLYIKANQDYLKSKTGNDFLTNHMTARVVEPVVPSPIVATVSKEPAKLFQGAKGEHNLEIEFSQLFAEEDKPGSYSTIVLYQGTPAD